MFGKKNKREHAPKGQGAAAAKQLGLFLDLNPEDMMDMNQDIYDPDLEAEFAAIVGQKPTAAGRTKDAAHAPLPMEDIAKMAEACMKDDFEDDDFDNLEDDKDLLAELQEVVGEEEMEDSGAETSTMADTPPMEPVVSPQQEEKISSTPGSLQHTLEDRIAMYQTAITNTKTAGESSKTRRYERGLKTLQAMLSSVRRGRKIEESEIPPPVACGVPSRPVQPIAPTPGVPEQESPGVRGESDSAIEPGPSSEEEPSRAASPALPSSQPSPALETSGGTAASLTKPSEGQPTKEMLLERQKEYKMAALKAKKEGDVQQAKLHLKTSKGMDAMIEALERGQTIDLSSLPPPLSGAVALRKGSSGTPHAVEEAAAETATKEAPSVPEGAAVQSVPSQPKTVLEALEQRMAKYKEASAQAKASVDDRKARMHDRIAKQYQSAIRAHKAGRPVNFDELPVPPGFPPIPGHEAASPEQGFAAVLEKATVLASDNTEAGGEEVEEVEEVEEGEQQPEAKPSAVHTPKKPTLAVPPIAQGCKRSPSPSLERTSHTEGLSATAVQQLEFLEGRRKQYMKAALQAKQRKELEQAKVYLRTVKSLEPMIEAVQTGKAVDISKVPSPPGDEDEDFIVVHHSDVQISERAEEVYTQLTELLKEQHKKCMTYSKQFTHLGNITETTKFEKMAEKCKKSLEILKLSQARGLDPPKHHFEERTYHTVRIFPELSSTDMVVMIVKGLNLPAPHGTATNDLDAFVKFEFPYPSSDHPQKQKTAVIKNTNCPEYNQSFTLNINRNHRGFRRVVQSKGLKLEVLHKGGFLRSDKPVGTAHLKLEKLETDSEVREIIEVMDGRKPTGGRLEVRVRLREPLSGQDLQTVTERWLVLEQPQVLL